MIEVKIDEDVVIHLPNLNGNIAVRVSGGADSAILLILICDQIRKLNLQGEVTIYPALCTFPNPGTYGKEIIKLASEQVLLFAREAYPDIRIKDQIQYPITSSKDMSLEMVRSIYLKELKTGFRYMLKQEYNIDLIFEGSNRNPSYQEALEFDSEWIEDDVWNFRMSDRDSENDSIASMNVPFWKINKKQIAKIYEYYNLTDTLFPLTWSCESKKEHNGWWTYHCGKCWWCKERMWGFGRLE